MINLDGIPYSFVEDPYLEDVVEDWSGVRSHGRARRRRRLGHPQRIKIQRVPKPEVYACGSLRGTTFVGHPETIRKLKEHLRAQCALHR